MKYSLKNNCYLIHNCGNWKEFNHQELENWLIIGIKPIVYWFNSLEIKHERLDNALWMAKWEHHRTRSGIRRHVADETGFWEIYELPWCTMVYWLTHSLPKIFPKSVLGPWKKQPYELNCWIFSEARNGFLRKCHALRIFEDFGRGRFLWFFRGEQFCLYPKAGLLVCLTPLDALNIWYHYVPTPAVNSPDVHPVIPYIAKR